MSLLWGIDLTTTIVFFSIGILIPFLRDDLGITPLEAGLLGSAGFLGFGVMAIPASIWLTRYSPRLTTLILTLGMGALCFAQALAPTGPLLLLFRFLFVLLAVSRIQVQVILLQQWFQPRLYAAANGIESGARSAGQLLASAATPVLIALLGSWRGFYLVTALAMTALGALWLLLGREGHVARSQAERSGPVGSPAGVLGRHKSLWVLALCQVGAATAFAAFLTFYPTYALDHLGISLTAVGLLVSVFAVGGLAGGLVVGPLSQWMGRRKPFVWVPGLVLPVIYIALVWVDSVPLSAALMFAAGLGAMGVAPVIFTIPLDMGLRPREVGVAQALIRTLFPFGATMGPILVAVIGASTGSLALGLTIVAPLALSLFIGGILLPETGARGQQREPVAEGP